MAQATPEYQVLATIGNTDIATMSLEEWYKVKTHPRQRSRKEHAKADHFKKMKKAKGVRYARSLEVSAAMLDGKLYRTDGHTRTYLWETGGLPTPKDALKVTIYNISSYDELNKLYETIDSRSAAKSSMDDLVGALRGNRILHKLNTREIRNGHIKSAVYMAIRSYSPKVKESMPENYRPLNLYSAVKVLKPGILALDKVGQSRSRWHYGSVGAALLSLTLWPETAEFWTSFNKGHQKTYGKSGQINSPCAALIRHVNDNVANYESRGNPKASRNPEVQRKLMGIALRCVAAWREEQADGKQHGFTKMPIAIEPSIAIEQLRTQLGLDYDVEMFMKIGEKTRSEKMLKTRSETEVLAEQIKDMDSTELSRINKLLDNEARLSPEVVERKAAETKRKKRA